MRKAGLFKNKLLLALLLAIFTALVLSALFEAGFLYSIQLKISDRLYSEKPGLREIVIVKIDDESIQEIGRWPWSRRVFAEFLQKIPESAVIGIDVSFFEKSNPEDDELLAQALQGRKAILAEEFKSFESIEGRLYGKEKLSPIEELDAEAGFVNLYTDFDGVSRSFPPAIKTAEGIEKGFALKIAEKFLETGLAASEGKKLAVFSASQESFQTYGFSEVLGGKVDAGELEGKIILVGATAPDLHDEIISPLNGGTVMPGVIAHANILQMLLKNESLSKMQDSEVLAIIFIFAIAVALLLARLKIWIAGIASVALAIGFLAFAVLRFENGVIMNIVFPALSIFATFGIVSAGFYWMEEKQKQWVKSIFGKYVSESVAKEILEKTSADEVRLGGSRKYVTILFADIRGFTSMSEKLQPEEVVELLNTYLSSMTKCVFENKGTLDKYIGDAIMAVFNAPLEQENHQLLAVKAALEMQKAVAELNAKLGKSLQYGIGVNSGFAVVGNIGSEKRLEYTAIGDSVNTASRLCGIAEGGQVLASLETFNAVKDKALAKKIGSLKVKNRKKPVMVFQILELKPEGLKD